MKLYGKVFLSITFVVLAALQLFAQTPNNNSSIKIEIKNSRYVVSGIVQSEAVKNEIVGKINEISRNDAEFSGLKVNLNAEPFAVDWEKGFDKALSKSKLWKSGVFIFTAKQTAAGEYPNMPDDILNADIFLTENDAPVRLADYRNKTIVLFFLASWCIPCRRQAERLNEFYSEIPAGDVEIIGVNVDANDKENFIKLGERLNLKYKLAMADEKFFEAALKISKFNGIPQAFLIRDGKLYGIFVGNSPNTVKKLEETILKVSKMR